MSQEIFDIILKIGSLIAYVPIIRTIWKYVEPKPDLKVELVVKPTGGNYLYMKMRNKGSRMATDVRCSWIIYRIDTQKQIAQSKPENEAVGYFGPTKKKTQMFPLTGKVGEWESIDEKYKYEIMIGLSCKEKNFGYIVLPLEQNNQLMTE